MIFSKFLTAPHPALPNGRFLTVWLVAACLFPAAVSAETASDVIDKVIAAEKANYAGVDNLFQRTRLLRHIAPEYFEKDGDYMRPVPLPELLERQQPNEMSEATPEQLEHAAGVLRMESARADAAFRQEIADSGLGGHGGMAMIMGLASNPPEQWLTSTPGGMMNLYATFLEGAAEAKREMAKEKADFPSQAEANLQMINDLKSRTRIIGHQVVFDRNAIELGADDLDVVQQTEDGTFSLESLRMLVDAERYLPVQFKIFGTLSQGAESRSMTIERIDSQFSRGDGCGGLLKPHRSVMRLGGMLTEQERIELAEAEAQLADLDKQLASMPAQQRDMMMTMMGPQIEMIKSLAAGGDIEVATEIIELRCNRPPVPEELVPNVL